jgi:hypothetical protein
MKLPMTSLAAAPSISTPLSGVHLKHDAVGVADPPVARYVGTNEVAFDPVVLRSGACKHYPSVPVAGDEVAAE